MFSKPTVVVPLTRSVGRFCAVTLPLLMLGMPLSSPAYGQIFFKDIIVSTELFSFEDIKTFGDDSAFNASGTPDEQLITSLANMGDPDASYALALLHTYPFLSGGTYTADIQQKVAYLHQSQLLGNSSAVHSLLFHDLQILTTLMLIKLKCDLSQHDPNLLNLKEELARSFYDQDLFENAVIQLPSICISQTQKNGANIQISVLDDLFDLNGEESTDQFQRSNVLDLDFYDFLASSHIHLAEQFLSLWDISENAKANALYSLSIAFLSDLVYGLYSKGGSEIQAEEKISLLFSKLVKCLDGFDIAGPGDFENPVEVEQHSVTECLVLFSDSKFNLQHIEIYEQAIPTISDYLAGDKIREGSSDFLPALFKIFIIYLKQNFGCVPSLNMYVNQNTKLSAIVGFCSSDELFDIQLSTNVSSSGPEYLSVNDLENILPYFSSFVFTWPWFLSEARSFSLDSVFKLIAGIGFDDTNLNGVACGMAQMSALAFFGSSLGSGDDRDAYSTFFGSEVALPISWFFDLEGEGVEERAHIILDRISAFRETHCGDSESISGSHAISLIIKEAWLLYHYIMLRILSQSFEADVYIKLRH